MTTTAAAAKQAVPRVPAPDHRNEVVLAGRLSMPAQTRQLPSGDELVSWRLIVDRPEGGEGPAIDVIDCVAFAARIRRAAPKWQPGQTIAVEGALRRRFWRSGATTASRYEVEVSRATRPG